MSSHDHTEYVDGCFRCDLSRDEPLTTKGDRVRRVMFGGRQGCCGATNPCCSRPPGTVLDYGTGCETCGHPTTCHAYTWSH